MEQSYVNAVIGNTSEFCEIFNNYEDELKNLGEKCDAISKEVEDYNNSVATNGNASEQSYDALDDARKYHDEAGNVIAYNDLTVAQKRGLSKDALFVADRGIELHDKMAEASYNMQQSARNFVKNLQSKLDEIKRSNSHLGQLNLQYVADMARNQNVIDDCLHEATLANTVDEKKSIAERRIQALKENRKTELTFRINMALINANNLIQATFMQAIANMEANIKDEFENVDTYTAGVIEEEMDIMSDLTKLMASFTNIKNEYQTEKELITSINEKCKAMKKAYDDKDVKAFANQVMKTTKEFSNLIEDIQKYNEEQKVSNDGPENNGPENNGPENNGPENNGPENNGPENNGPENNGPENNGSENNGPENNGPENNGPENNELDQYPVRQNQDVEYKVNRKRQADSAKRNLGMTALGIGLVAANGLGFAPIAGPLLSAGILAVAGIGLTSGVVTVCKRNAATRKLNKIAKEMQKEGLNIRLGEFDYEKGTVEYILRTEDGQDIPLRDADQDPRLIDALQDRLNKAFRNEQRGLGEAANRTNKFEIDMQQMPKVTVNNLEAAYAPIGGIRSFKDDVLGEAFSWDTHSSLIAKIKDRKFARNLKDREESPVSDADLEDIMEEPVITDEEVFEEEVTPEEEIPEMETPEQEAPVIDAPEQEAPVIDAPEQEAPEIEIPEVEDLGVQEQDIQEPNYGDAQNPEEEDLFAELEDPSAGMQLSDDEIAALLADLGNADNLEQGAEEIARAVEEEAPTRGR